MQKSETIGKLSKALSLAQSEIKGAVKDSTNPFFKASYADLSSVWDAIRDALTKNSLAIFQPLDISENGVIVETIISHESGEWISGKLHVNPTKNDPQGIGSAITYGRRYSLASMVGVCPEDDDGEGAMGRKKEDKKGSVQVAEKQGVPASSPEPPAPPKQDKDFAFLQAMGKEKERIGEVQYYNMLGIHGFEKSTEISDPATRKKVYNAMKTLKDKEKVNG